jgi:hypothetical protein
MVHGVTSLLDLHPEWVVLQVDGHNTINSISQTTIFQELWFFINTLDQNFPFVHQFYAHLFSLYFLEAFRHMNFSVISSKFGTR